MEISWQILWTLNRLNAWNLEMIFHVKNPCCQSGTENNVQGGKSDVTKMLFLMTMIKKNTSYPWNVWSLLSKAIEELGRAGPYNTYILIHSNKLSLSVVFFYGSHCENPKIFITQQKQMYLHIWYLTNVICCRYVMIWNSDELNELYIFDLFQHSHKTRTCIDIVWAYVTPFVIYLFILWSPKVHTISIKH